MVKASRYNLWCEADGGARLLFNAATTALAEIDISSLPLVRRLLDNPQSARTPEEMELRGHLEYGGYLVPNDRDELEELRTRNRVERLQGQNISLTIAPTLACNFTCDYCFEPPGRATMDANTEYALLDFARRLLPGAKSALVTWFGGEPTLCMPTIERIQEGLRTLCQELGVRREPAAIITNGYLLNRLTAGRLAACGVSKAQVTLDGAGPTHDRRRRLRGGQGTFERILANLNASADLLNILVRVNVDPRNADDMWALVDRLEREGLQGRVRIYFAPVTSAAGSCADLQGNCFSTQEFAAWQVDLYRRLIERGVYDIEYPALSPGGHCGADSFRSFVVAPDGFLFKCWEEIALGRPHSVGSVFEGVPADDRQCANRDRYSHWDPFAKQACIECPVLPICMGGCPYRGMGNERRTEGYCCSWKYSLQDMLYLRYLCDQRKEVAR